MANGRLVYDAFNTCVESGSEGAGGGKGQGGVLRGEGVVEERRGRSRRVSVAASRAIPGIIIFVLRSCFVFCFFILVGVVVRKLLVYGRAVSQVLLSEMLLSLMNVSFCSSSDIFSGARYLFYYILFFN